MAWVHERQLQDDVDGVLERVAAGEVIAIDLDGELVAALVPLDRDPHVLLMNPLLAGL